VWPGTRSRGSGKGTNWPKDPLIEPVRFQGQKEESAAQGITASDLVKR